MPEATPLLQFKSQHDAGPTAARYVKVDKEWRVVTCGGDGKVVLHASGDAQDVELHSSDAALNCIITTPTGDKLIVGDDQWVKILKTEVGSKPQVATRMTAPVRALATNPLGTLLAAAGDQDVIRIINIADTKVVKQLKVEGYVRSLAWDPEGDYLAALQANGCLLLWHVASGKREDRPRVGPRVDPASSDMPQVAWHPDGGIQVAVPGQEGEVTLYERLSWEASDHDILQGEHSSTPSALSICPNGLYAATGGKDGRICIWDMVQHTCMQQAEALSAVACLTWHPAANELLVACQDGSWAAWKGVVEAQLPGPHLSFDELQQLEQRVIREADAADATAADSEGVDFIDQDTAPEVTGGLPPTSYRPAPAAPLPPLVRWRPQQAVQSGSTPAAEGRPHFLVYNMLGCIVSRPLDSHHSVEVSFHDSSRRRVPPLTDYYGFTMAALSPEGAAYAAPASPEAPAVVLYRPFEAWAPNSDWTHQLPEGEEPTCICTGHDFLAVATSAQLLRVFSATGLQLAVLSLEGAPVALAAHEQQLAAVFHSGLPAADGSSQTLLYSVYDVGAQSQADSGRLPLSQGSSLTWLGFSDEGQLAAADSKEVLRVLGSGWGSSWVPVFSAAAERKQDELFWPVGLRGKQLLCVVCSPQQPHPQVNPRPILSAQALQVAVLAGEQAGSAELEAELLHCQLRLTRLHSQIDAAPGPMEAAQLEDEALTLQTQADKALLRLFVAAIKAQRLPRALDLASRLSLYPSLEGALKLANNQRATTLADRIIAIMQSRAELDAGDAYQQAAAITPIPSRAALKPLQATPTNNQGGTTPTQQQTAAASKHSTPPEKPQSAPSSSAVATSKAAAGAAQPQKAPRVVAAAAGGADAAAAQKKRPVTSTFNPFAKRSKPMK